jgi:pyruvate-ferredoxin/flavodoxin oxidoreductase
VWDELPREVQDGIIEKGLTVYTIDAVTVAKENGMGTRINTVMQTCFFALSGVLPREQAIQKIKQAIEKTYAKRGPDVVQRNFAAVDDTLQHLHQVVVPSAASARRHRPTRRIS